MFSVFDMNEAIDIEIHVYADIGAIVLRLLLDIALIYQNTYPPGLDDLNNFVNCMNLIHFKLKEPNRVFTPSSFPVQGILCSYNHQCRLHRKITLGDP